MITVDRSNVRVGALAADKADAISQIGELMVAGKYTQAG